MFKPIVGNCIDCPKGTKSLLVVKALRCHKHNEEFKQSKKSPEKLNKEREKQQEKFTKASNYTIKPRKVTGEKSVFDRIWQNRIHRCEVCDRPLIRKKNEVDMFSHVLSKGASTVMRLDEDFILLMGNGKHPNCRCHMLWESRTDNMRDIEMWKPVFILLDAAKKIGHQKRKNKPLYNENNNSQNQLESERQQNED